MWTVEDKIGIFFTRVRHFQIRVAEQCLESIEDSAPAALLILLSYFEMIAKYQDGFIGHGKSKHYFKQGVCSVFPDLESSPVAVYLLDRLYEVRCGFYHLGVGGPIDVVKESSLPIAVLRIPGVPLEESRIEVNPHLLIAALKAHLESFVEQLRDTRNPVLRADFERRFDSDLREP